MAPIQHLRLNLHHLGDCLEKHFPINISMARWEMQLDQCVGFAQETDHQSLRRRLLRIANGYFSCLTLEGRVVWMACQP
jgi:hypothetical protein